ncbi:MAG TPA: SigB/SigF/SigG family RNA polymerase sigma factor [Solirubrobacteraceae bacterium]|jgi:RNA polymerase sigma-B factor|nr:SigB/SigF/SigG family RNA polymerase sigma factor [Solirubrobacteraceae bacterium]
MALETLSTRSNVGSALRPADPDELFARWQKFGDRRARDELVERYMPLARRLARRYLGAREPFEDLVQVASLGLVKAIDRFDASRGNAFTSFAVPTILGELKRYFRDLGWAVHVPRGAQERALKVEEVQRELTSKTGRAPTITELAEYMELSLEDVLDALEAAGAHHSMSLDTPRDDGESDGGTIADVLGEEDKRFEYIDAGASIAQAAQQLSERERRILALRFIEDRTQTQIAEIEGVSQMQVSRVLRRALATLSELVEASDTPATGRRQLRR